MQIRRSIQRWTVVLVCAAALVAAQLEFAGAGDRVPAVAAKTRVADAGGGWVPRHLNACALGLGLMWGGATGMPINPLGGATAFAIGAGVALLACG